MSAPMARIDIVYRHVVNEPRGGVDRYYYREGQGRRIRLKAEPGTDAFRREVAAAAEAYKAAPGGDGTRAALPGSLRAWCERYIRTAHFRGLDAETQRVRRRIYEAIWAEPLAPGSPKRMGDCPMARLAREHVQMLVDRKAATPEAGRSRVKALRPVVKLALREGEIAANPCRDIEMAARSTEGHHTWTVEEIQRFEAHHPAGSKARLAMRILRCTGFRVSDAAQFGPQHVRDGEILKPVHKGRARHRKVAQMPILPELAEELTRHPVRGMAFLLTDYGRPFSIKGLGQRIKAWCVAAGLPHCSAHGVRKAAASMAAENGATEAQLMAIFTWDDPRQAAHYTRKARARRLTESAPALLGMGTVGEQNPAPNPLSKTG